MNLDNICTTPHAQGFIKVACELDPAFGDRRTLNEFVVTTRHHEQEANEPRLAKHPITEKLATPKEEGEGRAVREIPIRLFFNKAQNALGIKYQAYGSPGNAPVCAGNGKSARRVVRAGDGTQTLQELACLGPELCDLVQSGQAKCTRQVRMTVQIEGQDDPLSVFEVRSSSLNTYKALRGQLKLIESRFGGLRHVPLKLTIWQGSNEASSYKLFSLMSLELDAPSEIEAMNTARKAREELLAAGIDDDVDQALAPADGDEEEGLLAAADFQAVREFYEAAVRREGAELVTPATVQRRRGIPAELGTAANVAFSNAVRQVVPATVTSP